MGPEITKYLERIDATLAPFEGRFLVHGDTAEILEGEWRGDVIIIEFPDRASATRWYESAAYKAILPLRTRNSDGTVVLVDGVPSGHHATDILVPELDGLPERTRPEAAIRRRTRPRFMSGAPGSTSRLPLGLRLREPRSAMPSIDDAPLPISVKKLGRRADEWSSGDMQTGWGERSVCGMAPLDRRFGGSPPEGCHAGIPGRSVVAARGSRPAQSVDSRLGAPGRLVGNCPFAEGADMSAERRQRPLRTHVL